MEPAFATKGSKDQIAASVFALMIATIMEFAKMEFAFATTRMLALLVENLVASLVVEIMASARMENAFAEMVGVALHARFPPASTIATVVEFANKAHANATTTLQESIAENSDALVVAPVMGNAWTTTRACVTLVGQENLAIFCLAHVIAQALACADKVTAFALKENPELIAR